jgi:proline dehydrogenase
MSLLNSLVVRTLPLVPKPIVHRVSRRYIAGPTLDDAVRVVRALNERGISATLDVLGEFVTTLAQAARTADHYLQALDRIHAEGLSSNVSLKLTSLGLLLDPEGCAHHVRAIVERAARYENRVRIDMEDSTCTDVTLALFDRIRAEWDNVGIVLQAYLFRTEADAVRLGTTKANVRVCKGIYVEPRSIAFHERADVQENFIRVVRILLEAGSFVGIATHDESVVAGCEKIVRRLGLGPDRYEFQMLLGVRETLREEIVRRGHRMRVYVPFGEAWHAYSLRRLKENPAIAGHIVRATLGMSERGASLSPDGERRGLTGSSQLDERVERR